MKSSLDEYRIALDIAVMAIHGAAGVWHTMMPGVAVHLRRLADKLAARSARIRDREYERMLAEQEDEEVTERVTMPYGMRVPPDDEP